VSSTLRALALLLTFALPGLACGKEPEAPVSAETRAVYQTRTPSRYGIGKVYMGREIAFVMSYEGADWLERPERLDEERTDLMVSELGLRPTDVVADVGAGNGVLSFLMSARVPQGRVIAIDIQPEMLAMLRQAQLKRGIGNVETVLGTITDPRLPTESIDLALMVDAYHEFSHPFEMMQAIVRALRAGGRVALVEYRAEDPSVPILPTHKMTQEQAKKEMAAVGLRWLETKDSLPQQHLMLFEKPRPSAP
jgi:ubiquinone/menaquinone biosynthesis C-methylase UbiE